MGYMERDREGWGVGNCHVPNSYFRFVSMTDMLISSPTQ